MVLVKILFIFGESLFSVCLMMLLVWCFMKIFVDGLVIVMWLFFFMLIIVVFMFESMVLMK